MEQDSHEKIKAASGSGRRRFLGAGISGPALLTLISQPALGASVTCFTPSRSLSRNTSISQTAKNASCNGKSPGYWKQDQSFPDWPVQQSTLFHPIFSGSRFKVNNVSKTMLQVLKFEGNEDLEKMGFHVIGAYLNILKGLVNIPGFTVNELKGMWTAWDTNGQYEVTAGVFWNATQIKAYFLSNQISP